MKSMKGGLLKKLKSIKPIGHLMQDRVLQIFAVDGIVDYFPKSTNLKPQTHTQLIPKEPEREEKNKQSTVTVQEPAIIDVTELMRELEEEENVDFDDYIDDKENIRPPVKAKDSVSCQENVDILKKSEMGNCRQTPLSQIDVSYFRRPDLNCGTFFNPNLLAAFEQTVKEHLRISEAERRARIEKENIEKNREEAEREAKLEEHNLEQITEEKEEPPFKTRRLDDDYDDNPLLGFEEKCPPGGDGSVILFTTTLRGIRKTFEDCKSIRFLLESFRVLFYERDVSMHQEYKEELWRIMRGKVVPPKLFIKGGRYIGGALEGLGLHEQGKLRLLFERIPVEFNGPCEGCAGFRFVLCYKCSGSHKG